MKLVVAIVRTEKLNDVLEALYRAEVRGLTISRVRGHGGEVEAVETYRGMTVKRRRLTHSVVRRLALDLAEVVECSHFARPDFRIRNKIFATLPLDRGAVILKSLPANVDALVSSDSATFWNEWRGRWIGVR